MIDLTTPLRSQQPVDQDKAFARFRGGAYSDTQVREFLASLRRHCAVTGLAEAILAAPIPAKESIS